MEAAFASSDWTFVGDVCIVVVQAADDSEDEDRDDDWRDPVSSVGGGRWRFGPFVGRGRLRFGDKTGISLPESTSPLLTFLEETSSTEELNDVSTFAGSGRVRLRTGTV